jgi:hypothetical protein
MNKCEKCGFENRVENNYCAKCGAPLPHNRAKPTAKTSGSNQMNIAAGVIAIIIIVSVISGIFWWSSMMSAPGMSSATFTVEIDCDTEWSGSIGGLGGSSTESGYGDARYTITTSIVSAVIQKQTDWGSLTVRILRNNKVVAQQSTTAAYGVVTVSATS